jgi:hypothetical protein
LIRGALQTVLRNHTRESLMLLIIANGTVYDPANGVDGIVQDYMAHGDTAVPAGR